MFVHLKLKMLQIQMTFSHKSQHENFKIFHKKWHFSKL